MATVVAIGVIDGIAPVLIQENGQRIQTFFVEGGGGSGTVTQVDATGPITVTPGTSGAATYTIGLSASGVTAGGYGNSSTVGQFEVNAEGIITEAQNEAIAFPVTELIAVNPVAIDGGGGPGEFEIGLVHAAYAWVTNAAIVNLTGTPQVVATTTLTPQTTGKIEVTVSWQAKNTDSSNIHEILFELTNSADANTIVPVPVNIPVGTVGSGSQFTQASSFTIALDLTSAPSTFTVGTPVTLNVLAAADASGVVNLPAPPEAGALGGIQVTWRERLTT
jgi:hypothetical protein